MTAHRSAFSNWRAAELFAGIGGFSAAWPEVDVTLAMDINQNAAEVYRRNFQHTLCVREIESISFEELVNLDVNLWWLSPPCQPYTRRGNSRGHLDPRAKSLIHLIESIPICQPQAIALENVVGFEQSKVYVWLRSALDQLAYHVLERHLCPSEMGWPNRRPRFYLLACQDKLIGWQSLPDYALKISNVLNNSNVVDDLGVLRVPDRVLRQWEPAMHRVRWCDAEPTACFTSSYGRSIVHSGSYLVEGSSLRRFAPREVAGLLGFPTDFVLDACEGADTLNCSQASFVSERFRQQWRLLGNSLSLPSVRYVLSHLPQGPSMRIPWAVS